MQKRDDRPAVKKSPPVEDGDAKRPKEGLDLTALQRTPGFMIRILQVQIFEEFFAYFSPLSFSPAEHSVLITVRDNPSATQTEIASALRIQLPNLVKILLKLEAKDLIKRKRSNRDKRAVELILTASGEDVAEKAANMADAFNRMTLSPLSRKEQEQFLLMLRRLVHAQTDRPARSD